MYYLKINDDKYELNSNTELKQDRIILSSSKNKITQIKTYSTENKLYNIVDENGDLINSININEIKKYISGETNNIEKKEETTSTTHDDAYYINLGANLKVSTTLSVGESTISFNAICGGDENFEVTKLNDTDNWDKLLDDRNGTRTYASFIGYETNSFNPNENLKITATNDNKNVDGDMCIINDSNGDGNTFGIELSIENTNDNNKNNTGKFDLYFELYISD